MREVSAVEGEKLFEIPEIGRNHFGKIRRRQQWTCSEGSPDSTLVDGYVLYVHISCNIHIHIHVVSIFVKKKRNIFHSVTGETEEKAYDWVTHPSGGSNQVTIQNAT